jgi:hypothetical protein
MLQTKMARIVAATQQRQIAAIDRVMNTVRGNITQHFQK